jgi:two-component system, sensor histidine kinase
MSAIEGRSEARDAREELRARLRAAQVALDNVRGEVDAIVVAGSDGPQVYTVVNADQPYRTIIEEMQQGAVVLTPQGDIFYCNRGFEGMVRMRLEGVIGLPMRGFVAVADEANLEGLLAAGAGRLETVLRASDGTEVPAGITASLFGGTPAHICLVITDLTEQKRQATREAMFAREEAARAEAEAANRAKDQFLNMLSHELRNPLGVILNGVEVLDQTGSSEPGPLKIREVIRRQAHHLGKLLDDLLDVARVGQGKIDLRQRSIDLADVVSTASEDHRSRIERAGISLTVSLPPEIVGVEGDRTRLVQTIGNLLDNARKWTAAGGHISVSLQQVGQVAEMRVRDTGIGIDPQMREHIFDLFWQGQSSPGRSTGGLGIGLTLVRRLVELHGGTVEAVSDGVGYGSEFIVRLPVTKASVYDEAETLAPIHAASHRVLLIEDNADARDMARLGLELLGQTVSTASNGKTGVEMALADPPDAVIVDIGLPGLDGYEVGRRLREALGDRIRLVALTGYSQPEDRRRVREAGFDVHLVKPVVPPDILRAITTMENKWEDDGPRPALFESERS